MVDSEMYAILSEMKEHLELEVLSSRSELNHRLKLLGRKTHPVDALGSMAFMDNRNPCRIVEDFSEVHLGGENLRVQAQDKKFATIEYPLSFKPTLTTAFVNYFTPN